MRRVRRGFTAVELVVASSLLLVVLVGVVTLLMGSGREWSLGTARLSSDSRASLTLQALEQSIRNGCTATVNAAGTELTITRPLLTGSGDFDRTVASTTTTRYYLSQNTLFRQVGAATPISMGRGILSVKFTVTGQRVGIRLTAQNRTGIHTRETTLESETTLRNPLVQ